eukprot:scaffold72_cov76-Cylindrotheca_fusiformis.AAC.1
MPWRTLQQGNLHWTAQADSDSGHRPTDEKCEAAFNSLELTDLEKGYYCLFYHAYPTSWTLARKPKVGQPKPILTQNTRPTDEECEAAFSSLELTDLEKGVENALENVAGPLDSRKLRAQPLQIQHLIILSFIAPQGATFNLTIVVYVAVDLRCNSTMESDSMQQFRMAFGIAI